MIDLTSPNSEFSVTPPQFGLYKQYLPISIFSRTSIAVLVHFVAGGYPPLIRCNADDVDGCALCDLGFPALARQLMLAYDHDEDRLWGAVLPEKIAASILDMAANLPSHQWHFCIHWSGIRYFIEQDHSYGAKEFTLDGQERQQILDLLNRGQINLESAVPTLSNGAMLRLPMVVAAANCFGFHRDNLEWVERSEDSNVHW